MKKYDFDQIIKRKNSVKWDGMDLRYAAHPEEILPLWIADMDFRAAEPIIEALQQRVDEGIFGYEYRPESYFQSVTSWFEKRHHWKVQEDWLLHSPGVVTSLSVIIKEFTNPGDKIVIQTPVYFPFFKIIRQNDRTLVPNPLAIRDGRYVMDFENLEKIIDQDVKMLILCSPHNPVSRVWEKDELLRLGEICFKNGIRVLSDEIHADIVFKNHTHIPFASLGKEFLENTITLISPTKTFNLAGLHTSCVIAPNGEDREKFSRAMDVLDLKSGNCFGQAATEAAFRYGEEWLEQLLVYLEDNAGYTLDFIDRRIPRVKAYKPEGTYLLWMDFRQLGLDRKELRDVLLNKAKVALHYGEWFGTEGEGFVRLNFACPKQILIRALEGIEKAVSQL